MTAAVPTLKRRSEFLRIAGARQKWVAQGLILQARRRDGTEAVLASMPAIRIGYTVSRKVGNAVARNRARRRLRAAVALVLPEKAAEGYDYVVIGRGGTLTRPFDALVGDLEWALKRLGLRRGDDRTEFRDERRRKQDTIEAT